MRLFEVEGVGVDRDVDLIFQVLDAVVPDGEGSYLAAPISTGRRYFQALATHKITGYHNLIDIIGEAEYLRTIRWPNVEDGEAVASRLRQAGVPYLINTGPIFIKGWKGRDYMNLCLSLIEKKIKCVYFHSDWPYSTGAVEELIFCAKRGLTLLSSEGDPLTLHDAQTELKSVYSYFQSISHPTDSIEQEIAEIAGLIKSKNSYANAS